MDKYINGGIVKEMTVILKKEGDIVEALSKLGELLDLDLYDMEKMGNAVYLELKDDYVKEHLVSFLEELDAMHIPTFLNFEKKIAYIKKHLDDDLDTILENCDDIFQERFRMQDTFSINDSSFYLDVLCYVFYFDGPYNGGNFEGLLQYLHRMQKDLLTSPLKGALCFGLNA